MTVVTLDDINAALIAQGLPSYTDVAFALCEVLDGSSASGIEFDTGLSKADAQKVAQTRDGVKAMWLATINQG